jgi:hypothetical protein
MRPIPLQQIPQWLYQEVDQCFIPLPFQPATILDIGANIGAFAQRARQKWPDAKMICCEPMPFNVVQLRRNRDHLGRNPRTERCGRDFCRG